jgi:hypothetical protein
MIVAEVKADVSAKVLFDYMAMHSDVFRQYEYGARVESGE